MSDQVMAKAAQQVGGKRRRRRTAIEDGPHPVDVYVGRRLREARLLAGLNQSELGDAIGVSFQAVQKYETGSNRLSASRLFQAAKVLGRPVSFFFDSLEGEAPGPTESLARDEIELIRHYRHVGEATRSDLLELTKSISGTRLK
jgi:transcriptional regulator with XRE-family HTH domain